MPNETQCQELIDHTYSIWDGVNGVYGYKFVNKTDFSKYIFLPATGVWINSDYKYGGSVISSYYTTTMNWRTKNVIELNVYSNWDACLSELAFYYRGYPIRPVRPWTW